MADGKINSNLTDTFNVLLATIMINYNREIQPHRVWGKAVGINNAMAEFR